MSASTRQVSGKASTLGASTDPSDFLLKPEILRAISDLGFEHPSEGKASQTSASEVAND